MSALVRRGRLLLALDAAGLGREEAARFVGVSGRALNHWLNGRSAVPDDALAKIEGLAASLDAAARATQPELDAAAASGKPPAVVVYRLDPHLPAWAGLPSAAAHLALVRRLGRVTPVVFEPDAYRAWLAGRADSQALRAAWAASVAASE